MSMPFLVPRRSTAAMSPQAPAVERLRPLLYRHLSASLYRRSERYARHVALVGSERVLPQPPLVDRLAVWLAGRLPARVVVALGSDGLFRGAKLFVALLKTLGLIAWLLIRILRGLTKSARSVRRTWRSWRQVGRGDFDTRPPVGFAGIVLGGVIRFRGFRITDHRLTCWYERLRPFENPCQIFVHLYPADPQERVRLGPLGRHSLDHHPRIPVSAWPPRRAYRDETLLADLPPGDYRVEVGLFDLAAGQRIVSDETGQSAIDLGWIRLASSGQTAPTTDPSKPVVIPGKIGSPDATR